MRTPSGSPSRTSGAMIRERTVSIASSRVMPGGGRISRVTVRTRSRCSISVGPAVTSTSASERTGRMAPDAATTGRFSICWVRSFGGPASTKSSRFPPAVTSATRRPSLNTSTVSPSSRTLTPLSASRARSGAIRTSGAPSSSPGFGRTWVPPERGRTCMSCPMARRATSRIGSRSGPLMSRSTRLPPPTVRPKSDGWVTKP